MNRHARLTAVACAAAALMSPATAAGQDPFEKVIVEPIDATAFPRGVRALGMGMTGTADATDPANAYYNPAVLAYGPGLGVTGATNNWMEGFDFHDVGVSAACEVTSPSHGAWHAGAGIRYVDMHFDGSSEALPAAMGSFSTTAPFNDWYLATTVAGGYSPGGFDLSAGFSVKYLDSGQLPGVDASTWTYDAGALARYTYHRRDGLDVVTSGGVSALSLGGGGSADIEPVDRLRAGLGFRIEAMGVQESGRPIDPQCPILAIAVHGELVDYLDGNRDLGSGLGVEMSLVNIMSIRYGYADTQYAFDYGQTFGGGLGYGWGHTYFRLDFAMTFETNLSKNIGAVGILVDIDA